MTRFSECPLISFKQSRTSFGLLGMLKSIVILFGLLQSSLTLNASEVAGASVSARASAGLPSTVWQRYLDIQFKDGRAQRVFLFEASRQLWFYDRDHGSRRLFVGKDSKPIIMAGIIVDNVKSAKLVPIPAEKGSSASLRISPANDCLLMALSDQARLKMDKTVKWTRLLQVGNDMDNHAVLAYEKDRKIYVSSNGFSKSVQPQDITAIGIAKAFDCFASRACWLDAPGKPKAMAVAAGKSDYFISYSSSQNVAKQDYKFNPTSTRSLINKRN